MVHHHISRWIKSTKKATQFEDKNSKTISKWFWPQYAWVQVVTCWKLLGSIYCTQRQHCFACRCQIEQTRLKQASCLFFTKKCTKMPMLYVFLVKYFGQERKLINGVLLPKLFWPTVRKNWSSDREKVLKFETEGREFENFLRSLDLFVRTVQCKVRTIFGNRMFF